jgi:hypothetical protein
VYLFLEFYTEDFKRGYVNRLPNWIINVSVISFILSACVSSMPVTAPPVETTNLPPGRFGTTSIEARGSSGIRGMLTAKDNGNGTTTLSINLDRAGEFNPWGIYATGDCQNGVPENTRPVFSLPDVESGKKEETVETETYRSVPGELIVIIYGLRQMAPSKWWPVATWGRRLQGTWYQQYPRRPNAIPSSLVLLQSHPQTPGWRSARRAIPTRTSISLTQMLQ